VCASRRDMLALLDPLALAMVAARVDSGDLLCFALVAPACRDAVVAAALMASSPSASGASAAAAARISTPLHAAVCSAARFAWVTAQFPGLLATRGTADKWAVQAALINDPGKLLAQDGPLNLAAVASHAPLKAAVRRGHLDLAKDLYARGAPWDYGAQENTALIMARSMYDAALAWAAQNVPGAQADVLFAAALHNRAALVHLIMQRDASETGYMATVGAAYGGHIAMLRHLEMTASAWGEANLCGWAAKGGHLDALRWLLSAGYPWDIETIMQARLFRFPHVEAWSMANRCPDYFDLTMPMYRND
jgi:hypothetical protein